MADSGIHGNDCSFSPFAGVSSHSGSNQKGLDAQARDRPTHDNLRNCPMLTRSTCRIHGLACWILIGLGTAHALGTLVDIFVPTFFAPRHPQTLADMRATTV